MEEDQKITVAVLEDHLQFREILKQYFLESEDIDCIADFDAAEKLLGYLKNNTPPDVLLLDIMLPGGITGIDALQPIFKIAPDIKVLILTVLEDQAYIYDAFKKGVSGYLLKSADRFTILDTIVKVYHGYLIYSVDIASRILSELNNVGKKAVTNIDISILTPRETEILRHISLGYSYKRLAEILYIAEDTVNRHLQNIYRKLQVNNRHSAGEIAKEAGLLGQGKKSNLKTEVVSLVFVFDKKGKPVSGAEVCFMFRENETEISAKVLTNIYGKAAVKHFAKGTADLFINGTWFDTYELPDEIGVIMKH